MSEFSTEGYDSFPNLYSDEQQVADVALWSDQALSYKIQQYHEFLQRRDIMPRAQMVGVRILDLLEFELRCRVGLYEMGDA